MTHRKANLDRRYDDRHPGTGLRARIEDCEVEVVDVSIGGVKIALPPNRVYQIQNKVEFVLVSTHWPDMAPAPGRGVVRAATRDWIAVQFVNPTYNLMKCVSRHVGTLLWGNKPYGY